MMWFCDGLLNVMFCFISRSLISGFSVLDVVRDYCERVLFDTAYSDMQVVIYLEALSA